MKKYTLFENGFISTESTPKLGVSASSSVGGRRGVISSFSASSRRRMRDFLISHRVLGSDGLPFVRVGVTLTVPFDPWRDEYLDVFSDIVHRFRVSWLRRFPSSGSVFRVELQKRGAPHLHMISYHAVSDLSSLHDDYLLLWVRAVGDVRGGSFSAFLSRGLDLDLDICTTAAIRYLCDHASKSKQAQLGYKGKQWGIWGRRNFSSTPSDVFDVDDRVHVLASRVFRKILRFRVKSDCVFGSRLSHVRRSRRVSFVSPDTVLRVLLWASSI